MTRRYNDLEDFLSDLDSESILDDPLLGSFNDEELAMMGAGSSHAKPKAAPAPKKKRGRPKKKQD